MSKTIETINGTDDCSIHGSYSYVAQRVGKFVAGKVCPHCLQQSLEMAEKKNRLKSVDFEHKRKVEKLKNSGIPYAFYNCTMENYELTSERSREAMGIVHAYINSFKRVLSMRPAAGMIFTGIPGTGKTHIACSIISKLLSQGYSAAYISAPQFLTAMEDSRHGRHDLSSTKLIANYAAPSLLVIDEYGAHTTKDNDYQALFSLVDLRYQSNLPTILITNLAHQEDKNNLSSGVKASSFSSSMPAASGGKVSLQDVIDDRLIERIRGSRGPLLAFDWPSRRNKSSSIELY